MVPSSSRELLEVLLEDEALTLEELKAFVAKGPREDLWLDYKDGRLLQDVKEARLTVRRWVSGFANAEGGVLVLGFDEGRPRQLSPCVDRIGDENLATWAGKALGGMEGLVSPRIRGIPVERGREVLLIAVPRAAQLVPCYDRYYLRFADSTPEVPAYLISDITLGRRQHPVLVVTLREVKLQLQAVRQGALDSMSATLSFELAIENASLAPGNAVDVGLVLFTHGAQGIWSSWRHPVTAHLRQQVELAPPSEPEWELVHLRLPSPVDISCFTAATVTPPSLHVPRWRTLHPQLNGPELTRVSVLKIGLYLAPKGSAPSWFQVTFSIPGAPRRIEGPIAPVRGDVTPKLSGRPVVTWQVLDHPEE